MADPIILDIPVKYVVKDDAELEELEAYRKRFAHRLGREITLERFIAWMFETGAGPQLNQKMQFYVGDEIDGAVYNE